MQFAFWQKLCLNFPCDLLSDQNCAWISHAICMMSPLTILNFIYLTTIDKEWKFIQLMYNSFSQFLIFKEYYASFTRPGNLSQFTNLFSLWCTATFVAEAQRMDQNITNLYTEESVIIFTINICSSSLSEVELMSRSRWCTCLLRFTYCSLILNIHSWITKQ